MIPERANDILLGMFLALYGVITLSGPALHSLPGFGHESAAHVPKLGAVPGHGERGNTVVHDCPICHFHAQGQLVADPDSFPCTDVVRIRAADEPQLSSPLAVDRPSIPRAPPLV